ncbi:MAG: hypothetical protein COV74_06125 [Candidatus Omnitrophica bacterium CG11_big_fil_rev_8_21_14_0_20_45_26]|uniref:Quinate/shikimate 5-dehydrogenase/glutamyl-tRNA reductase domain-containing protein n=1 Tax=Candidatus Abzuiibacterium crystallinum TaxID=1974748 RepID=A0A2H0LNR8_9BACT|nr:MAG: hypothetical protein COV74_06125 [Candidatus Omnitrophica bacterium CG11_big_fil_rev_8_21_14_0_20_45_26]PIW63201.1 MAG: hypothetical protein COW12_11315 [Candidatus Omnitrophica bacterium CG12_big_fil_rev_8_21_14_0_65_45_16]
MVQVYRKKWARNPLKTFFNYLRDSIVCALPIKKLPKWLCRILYGISPRFVFLVHPRAYQDVFISAPFLAPIKFLFKKSRAFTLVSLTSPFILNSVRTPQGVDGFVIAQLTVPEIMMERRHAVQRQLEKMVRFVSKISHEKVVIGLGGWFPMVTRRGSTLHGLAQSLGLLVTNGHCGTLASIYLMIEKIARIGGIELSTLNIVIIGVGKMGTNVARAFNGKVNKITLIDIKESNLTKTKDRLESSEPHSEINVFLSGQDKRSLKEILREHHVGVCATSTFRNVFKLRDMPKGFIAIDDSRPEALPRDPRNERIILEGGLLKIEGTQVDYNYGFGEDDNVFGCLGEAFLVSYDCQHHIKPTLGDVDLNNFFALLELCKKCGVVEGDFKSKDTPISDEDIRIALESRGLVSNSARH